MVLGGLVDLGASLYATDCHHGSFNQGDDLFTYDLGWALQLELFDVLRLREGLQQPLTRHGAFHQHTLHIRDVVGDP